MRNITVGQNRRYVDSLSGNTKKDLCQKVYRGKSSGSALAGYIGSSWTKTIITGIAFFFIIIFSLTFDLPGLVAYAKSSLSISSQLSQNLIAGMPTKSIWGVAFLEQGSYGLSVLPAGGSLRLKIPGINVNAIVEPVGLTEGTMEAPKDPSDVAWFNLGSRPGEKGSAVIAGHFDSKNGTAAVFNNLHKLSPGDKLYIEDDKGVIISFVVRESRKYDSNADASDVFSSNDGKAHLNLITCGGVWNKASKSYSQRLVVFADKETE